MASGIRVKPLSELTDITYRDHGSLFLVGVPRSREPLPSRVHVLDRLAPTADVAALARRNESSYRMFRERYWRLLGTRSNVEQLAKIRRLGKRSPGVTLLTEEAPIERSSAAAIAELLDAENQRPPDWGRYGYVYVVELETRGAHKRPEVYIGDTEESPEERFAKHVKGHRRRRSGARTSNSDVLRRGKRLAYELFKHLNPIASREEACEAAKRLRVELEREYEIRGSPECMERIVAATRVLGQGKSAPKGKRS